MKEIVLVIVLMGYGLNLSAQKGHKAVRSGKDVAEAFASSNQTDSALFYYEAMPLSEFDALSLQCYVSLMAGKCRMLFRTYNDSLMLSGCHRFCQWDSLNVLPRIAETGAVFYHLGQTYSLSEKYEDAIAYYQDAMTIWHGLGEYEKMLRAMVDRGNAFRLLEELDSAYRIANEALVFASQHQLTPVTALGLLATVQREKKQYASAIENYSEALKMARSDSTLPPETIATIYNGLAWTVNENRAPREAVKYGRKGFDYLSAFAQADLRVLADLAHNLADFYSILKMQDSAWYFFDLKQQYENQAYHPEHPTFVNACILKGNIWRRASQCDSAIAAYRQGLRIRQKSYPIIHPVNVYTHIAMGYAFKSVGRMEEAFEAFLKAVRSCLIDTLVPVNRMPVAALQCQSRPSLLESFYYLEATWLDVYSATGNVAALDSVIYYASKCDTLMDVIRSFAPVEGDKISLVSNFDYIYDRAIMACYLSFVAHGDSAWLQKAFYFMEKNRSFVLYTSILDAKVRRFVNIPVELTDQEATLRRAIFDMEKKTASEGAVSGDYKSRIEELKAQYNSLMETIYDQYPDYGALRYGQTNADPATIQAALRPEEGMIVYFLGKQSHCMVFLTQKEFHFVLIDSGYPYIDHLAARCQRALKGGEDFATEFFELYCVIMKPLERHIQASGVERLIVIPDRRLLEVPFEVMVASLPAKKGNGYDYSTFGFLLKQYAFVYHYSANLWLHSRVTPRRTESKLAFCGFAPEFGLQADCSRSYSGGPFAERLPRLPYAKREIQIVDSLFRLDPANTSIIFTGDEADEAAFRAHAGEARYVLLATHGYAEGTDYQQYGLYFNNCHEGEPENDGFLYTPEMYAMELNADLVAISACKSGSSDTVITGEGIMALTRGFLYSGAENLLITLWKVHDKYTMEFMKPFFTDVLKGKDMAQCLRSAKLEFINRGVAPDIWAPFVLLGN